MNHLKYLIGLLLIISYISCERDYDAPPLSEPKYEGKEVNITIAKLKSIYKAIKDPTIIDTDFVLKGYVVGNDISGNIYKQLYIQDETAGINIGVDQNSVYTEYRVGQEVIIALKGLSMVKYGGQLQIGYSDTKANRIPWEKFKNHVSKNSWPSKEKVIPKGISLSDISPNMVNMLVKLNGIYFVDGGKDSFSIPTTTTNRVVKDTKGNSIIVRNSSYAKFAADILPKGIGSITGILSKFNDTWQFILRSKDDVGEFDGKTPEDTPKIGETDNIIFEEPFAAELGSFSQYSVKGNNVWKGEERNGDKYVKMTGYQDGENEDWLLSPKLDFTGLSSATINFSHAIGFQGNMSSEETLWISSNYSGGDPAKATWKQITITYPPKKPFWTWVDVAVEIPQEMFGKPKVAIAFRYTCGNNSPSTWELKNFSIKSEDEEVVIYPEN